MKSYEIGGKRTRVFYLHGLRGHGLSQKAALEHMAKNLSINMVSLELSGHGEESISQHCFVPYYSMIVGAICEEVRRQAMDAEQVILMGHSFGGSLMALAGEQLQNDDDFNPQVVGFIGISTALHVAHNVPKWQLMLSRVIVPISRLSFRNAWIISHLFTIGEMTIENISADETVQQSIRQDRLVYKGRIPLATSAQVYQAGIAAQKVLSITSIPSLLLHSQDDEIALPPKQSELAESVTLKLFKHLRHNCIDGIFREAVLARKKMTQFIVEKL